MRYWHPNCRWYKKSRADHGATFYIHFKTNEQNIHESEGSRRRPQKADYSITTICVNRTSAFLVGKWGSISPTRPTFLPISPFKFICDIAPLGKA